MICSPTSLQVRPKKRAGFTLVEVMIAAFIGAVVMAGVLSTFLFLVKSGVRASNYTLMEKETRMAFEQLGMDARMANRIQSHFTSGVLTSFTLSIPNSTLSAQQDITYVYDTTDPTNKKLVRVPGIDPAGTAGRKELVGRVGSLSFLRYTSASVLVPASTTDDTGVKHVQISLFVSRSGSGVAAATQVIRSSAFTLRNI